MIAPRRRSFAFALAAGLAVLGAAPSAWASEDDGLYGRFDGDLDLRGGAGVALAQGGASLAVSASALYLSTAGLYVHYTDALGQSAPHLYRTFATGVTLAPFFLWRYASNYERGPARKDLLADSITLQIGTIWAAPPGGSLRARPGLDLALGVSLPILPSASGLFVDVRGGLRFVDADLAPDTRVSGSLGRSAFISLTLGWHQIVASHLVDAGDRVVR